MEAAQSQIQGAPGGRAGPGSPRALTNRRTPGAARRSRERTNSRRRPRGFSPRISMGEAYPQWIARSTKPIADRSLPASVPPREVAALAMARPVQFDPGEGRRCPAPEDIMFDFLQRNFTLLASIAGAVVFVVIAVLRAGLVVIRQYHSPLLIKKVGLPLAQGQLVACEGEAGYQATMLPPGWHFPVWSWIYKVVKVPLLVVRPGEIALVVAKDGAPLPSGHVLGKEVPCDNFQDAAAFLRAGGQRGRQLGFLRAGSYRINPAVFELITSDQADELGLTPEEMGVVGLAAEKVGIVTTLDGAPIPPEALAGPRVASHDSFQSAQKFLDAGGCRGLQEEVLLSGTWNLNPWFVRVEPIPLTEIPIGYVGVVVSYVGREHIDISGDAFTHGDLVERGRKGVWVEPLLPGKHPMNTR